MAKDFYPLQIGFWQEYKVDSIIFSDFTDPITIDTFSYFIKENIESKYKDLKGEDNYRIEQFKKNDNSSSYLINHIISVKQTSTNLQRVENDLRFIKLVFPAKKDLSWNGNIYI
ncbi:MAG: hypothetical protein HF967_01715, partial [Methanosarcinales archaeon]|nr:hypothetical protein [Methanosarcinales archaeon]